MCAFFKSLGFASSGFTVSLGLGAFGLLVWGEFESTVSVAPGFRETPISLN